MRHTVLIFLVFSGCGPGGGGDDMGVGDLNMMPANCSNGMKDADETDVDCGGSCAPCGTGKGCKKPSDCQSKFCSNNLCDAPSCNDTVKNGDESDTDCGGTSCPGCAIGKMCNSGFDCLSLKCTNGACATAGCSDGKKDDAETDVDCGGGICPPCATGKACLMGTDCASGMCTNNTCKAAAGCGNMMKDGAETDVDCGGGACPTCGDGKMCVMGTDCTSNNCAGNVCGAAATCNDMMKNGAETDVDCGGGMCGKCPLGKMCAQPSDCVSGVCSANKCSGGMGLTLSFKATPFVTTQGPTSLAVADYDLDGKLDLGIVCNNSGAPALATLIGDGAGSFKSGPTLAGLKGSTSIAAADFNADNKADLLVAAGMETLLGNGNGSFQLGPSNLADSVRALTLADFNGDGKPDYALPQPGSNAENQVVMGLGVGNGTFTAGGSYKVFAPPGGPPAAGDFNRDGRIDLAAPAGGNGGGVSILLNSGSWQNAMGFAAAVRYPTAQSGSKVAVAFDANGDGFLDVAATSSGAAQVAVLLGKGDGTFQGATAYGCGVEGFFVATADFNKDGFLDLAVQNELNANTVSVLLGVGDGTFKAPVSFAVGKTPSWIGIGDFNGDGKPDMAVTNAGDASVSILLNTSS